MDNGQRLHLNGLTPRTCFIGESIHKLNSPTSYLSIDQGISPAQVNVVFGCNSKHSARSLHGMPLGGLDPW